MDRDFTREEALELLNKHIKSEALIKHSLAAEGVMRHFAGLFGGDADRWGNVGLLHDLDYEKYPELHCKKAAELLKAEGADDQLIHAVCSHGYGLCSDVEPGNIMELTLYTIDELTGLINAAAIMRPSKSVLDLEYKSVWKKFNQANFAAGVNRSVIENGCKLLKEKYENEKTANNSLNNKKLDNIDMRFLIEEAIIGMRSVAAAIGL